MRKPDSIIVQRARFKDRNKKERERELDDNIYREIEQGRREGYSGRINPLFDDEN